MIDREVKIADVERTRTMVTSVNSSSRRKVKVSQSSLSLCWGVLDYLSLTPDTRKYANTLAHLA